MRSVLKNCITGILNLSLLYAKRIIAEPFCLGERVTRRCRQSCKLPSCIVSGTVSSARWQRGRRGLTGYVRAANKCLNVRASPEKGRMHSQTGWHHPDNGAARASLRHYSSPRQTQSRGNATTCTCRNDPTHKYVPTHCTRAARLCHRYTVSRFTWTLRQRSCE